MNWPKKAAIYICLAALCLAAWQFPRLKRWTLIGYTMVTSDRVNAPTLSLSNSGRGKVKTATRMLIDHLGPEVNSPQHSPNAWTMAQMAISLEGQSQVNKEHVQRFLSDLMSPDCNCWHEGSQSPKDLRVSTWVLIGMSRLGLSASDEQLDFLLNTMQPDGWWTIYTEHPNKGGMPINQKYASTYATALSLLALSLQSQLKNADPIKKEKVKDAIKRGRNWLLKTRLIGRARWSDYPFNDDKSETLGVTGLVLHVLHSTSENANELNEIDQLWLDDLPGLKMDAKGRETSSVVIDTFNLRDPSSQFPLQWSIVATVDAYPSGTSLQKAKAIVWLDNIAENFEDLAKGVIGETDWIAAELLIALRYLQGEKVI
jgi:hypothetical protein